MTPSRTPCHVCGQAAPQEFASFPALARVTSDCRPFRPGGKLGLCPACHALQKVADAAFDADCAEIYAAYRLYHQGEGKEQRIFDQQTGASRPRSSLVIDHLASLWGAPGNMDPDARPKASPKASPSASPSTPPVAGRLLDIGCGEGFFLEAFGRRFPGWELAGLDMGERYRSRIESLPGVTAYHQGDPALAQGPWDVITLNHTLEHIPHPVAYLRGVRGLLAPGGLLLLNVPDWTANPFDLVIADHCAHFTGQLLAGTLQKAGFSLVSLRRDCIPKEWLAVAAPAADSADVINATSAAAPIPQTSIPPTPLAETPLLGDDATPQAVQASLDWLERFAAQARRAQARRLQAGPNGFGLFGTAIAGVWLDAALQGGADFFVDEAPDRSGSEFMGRPVFSPRQVPAGATVFLAFPPHVAQGIARRLAALPLTLTCPEP